MDQSATTALTTGNRYSAILTSRVDFTSANKATTVVPKWSYNKQVLNQSFLHVYEESSSAKWPVFFSPGSFAYYFARVRANLGFGVRVSEIKATNLVNIFVSHRVVPYDDKNSRRF